MPGPDKNKTNWVTETDEYPGRRGDTDRPEVAGAKVETPYTLEPNSFHTKSPPGVSGYHPPQTEEQAAAVVDSADKSAGWATHRPQAQIHRWQGAFDKGFFTNAKAFIASSIAGGETPEQAVESWQMVVEQGQAEASEANDASSGPAAGGWSEEALGMLSPGARREVEAILRAKPAARAENDRNYREGKQKEGLGEQGVAGIKELIPEEPTNRYTKAARAAMAKDKE